MRDFFYYLLKFILLHQLKQKIKLYDDELTTTTNVKKASVDSLSQVYHNVSWSFRSQKSDRYSNKAEVYSNILKQLIRKFEDNLIVIGEIKNEVQHLLKDNSNFVSNSECKAFHFRNKKIYKLIKGTHVSNILW